MSENQVIKSTDYCDLLKEVQVENGENISKLQRIRVKSKDKIEIRFAFYKNNHFVPRPLDLSEDRLLELLKKGIDNEVFSSDFVQKLRSFLLQKNI